jgi:hypothetical protein
MRDSCCRSRAVFGVLTLLLFLDTRLLLPPLLQTVELVLGVLWMAAHSGPLARTGFNSALAEILEVGNAIFPGLFCSGASSDTSNDGGAYTLVGLAVMDSRGRGAMVVEPYVKLGL